MQQYIDYVNGVSGKVLLGCDGFVDEVYQLVKVRQSLTDYTAMEKLKDFGELIVARQDGGVGLEMVPKRRCSGGFTPNTGRVVAFLGLKPTLIGLYGGKDIDPAFEELQDNSRLISLGDPALTVVLEFHDGKVLMSALKTVADLTWKEVCDQLGPDQLKELFADVDILGLGYWSLTPDFDNFLDGFISQYEGGKAPRRMFFDFADINKKSQESFNDTIRLMGRLNEKIPMTISFNEHEGKELFSRFSLNMHEKPDTVAADLTKLRKEIGIDELIIHTPTFAAASHSSDGEAFAIQDTQTEVIRTAGAGDTFNGGYLCASLGDLPIKERLVIANAATAYFVTHATAPDKNELLAQIEKAKDR